MTYTIITRENLKKWTLTVRENENRWSSDLKEICNVKKVKINDIK